MRSIYTESSGRLTCPSAQHFIAGGKLGEYLAGYLSSGGGAAQSAHGAHRREYQVGVSRKLVGGHDLNSYTAKRDRLRA